MSLLYLDYNRTTPLAPSVLEAMQPYWATHYMLPGQEHAHAHAVGEALENARENIAAMAGCESFEVVFTSGGTEANNLGILGLLAAAEPGHVLVSELEHESVLGPLSDLPAKDSRWQIETVPCEPTGMIDPAKVEAMLRPQTRLVCLQGANPILGTLQPVREVADRCHNRGVVLHCDATQMFGKVPVNVKHLRADTVAISGHKFYGPKGSGAIYVRRGLKLDPITFGEPREMGLRPGAENIPGCIGLGTAASLAERYCVEANNQLSELRDRFVEHLRCQMKRPPRVLCEESPRLPNTVALELPGEARRIHETARELAVATAQSACPPDEFTRSLRAIGCSESQIGRTMRVSLGWTTSREQVERAAGLIAEAFDI
ncbi:cysteine desulfurase [Roseiconus nitratireducens]|uniref:Cysteine desulfurase n=1 Tax=Roseiconus nitratireducens TaxID=2605748 RepID=A0A5M6D8D5_9BACT|nr:cysteine desulfurase family protein [Roseiconus nitratireducens]KAA5543777.1 cysteine desulfurase [Roseiconus nitratireducens]